MDYSGWNFFGKTFRKIIRLKTEKTFNGQEEVSAYPTYANNGNSSFSSCSSYGFKNDSEAILDSCRRCYHSW